MIFSDLYKSSRSRLRQSQQPMPPPLELHLQNYDPDLLSKDKTKQKEAVKRHLAEKVRNDWVFTWPAAEPQPRPAAAAAAESEPVPPATARATTASAPAANSPPPSVDEIPGAIVELETSARPDLPTPPATATGQTPLDATIGQGQSATAAADEPIDSGAEADSDAGSVYSVVSDDPARFRARTDWVSDYSEDDDDGPTVAPSPFRFESPDSVGTAAQASVQARRTRRRRELRDEMAWNPGLACFTARRDAWTGARTVRLRPRPVASPTSPTSPRRSLWRFRSQPSHGLVPASEVASPSAVAANSAATAGTTATTEGACAPVAVAVSSVSPSPFSPITSASRNSQQSAAAGAETVTPPTSDGDSHGSARRKPTGAAATGTTVGAIPPPIPNVVTATPVPQPTAAELARYPVTTVLPVPQPLLPPGNPMRASITPAIYLSIYDKVVSHSLQPSCPINLSDMMRSCVAGWKRDGEWPPRNTQMDFSGPGAVSAAAAAVVVVRNRRRREREEEQERRKKERRESAAAAAAAASSTAAAGGGQASPSHGRRLSFAGLIGRGLGEESHRENGGDDGSGKGIRRSLQRVLGLGHGHSHSVSLGGGGPVGGVDGHAPGHPTSTRVDRPAANEAGPKAHS